MDDNTNLTAQKGVEKIKDLVDDIKICLFCTHLKTDDGSKARPMAAQEVDDEGNIWFFSGLDSDKNQEIKQDKHVQLFFSDPSKSSFLVVNGEAQEIVDHQKFEEYWSPLVKTWFKEGKDDPNLSLIKVVPHTNYYWDVDGNRMVNFLKMLASVATGTNLVTSEQGSITV
jgi:general stress protein 26